MKANERRITKSSAMLERIIRFNDQVKEAVSIGQKFRIPDQYLDAESVIVTGMGASGIAGDLLRAAIQDQLRIPLIVNKSGTMPTFVNDRTLVFAVSYSGTTKETIQFMKSAFRSGAMVIGLTSGSEMQRFCEENHIPCIKVPTGEHSRTSLGYVSFPILIALEKLKLISNIASQIRETIDVLEKIRKSCEPNVSIKYNQAKILAKKLFNKLPIIYGEYGFTDFVALRWAQQLNENSKIFALHNALPEVAHVEVNAWNPSNDSCKDMVVILLRDSAYEKKENLGTLVKAVREVLDRQTEVIDLWSRGESELARLLSLSYIGDFTSIYLAILRGVDPSTTDNSSYIKGLEYM